jgi:hypothetical protein
MKRTLLYFTSAWVLLCFVSGNALAEKALRSTVKPKAHSVSPYANGAAADAVGGNEYYVDCSAEGKNGDGRSSAAAWHTLNDVNEHQFLPGDVIHLKRGTECHGFLWPKGSGSASAVIRLTAYGQGARPKIIAGKDAEEAFKLFDQEYWDVDSIEFAGGTLFGVFVSGEKGILHHIHLRNLVVHDVHGGEVKHKESGLVVISPGKVQQHFDDVLVDGVTAYRTEQWAGILVGGGNFGEVGEENWNTHVVVRNSVVHDVYGDGIILFQVKDGLIDTSAAWNTGMQPTQSIGTPNAIWTWRCKDCVVSKNEAFLTDSPGVDGGAFDIDWGNTRNSVLGNYGHDTQGYCIAVFGAGYVTRDSVVEGNLCINNGKSPRMARYQGAIFLWTWNNGVIENLRVERNTIYWSPPGNVPALLNRADIRGSERIFRGNEIYSNSSLILASNKEMSFQGNRYVTCRGDGASWVFGNETYKTFAEFQSDARQEQGSTWKSDKAMRSCLGTGRSKMENGAKHVPEDNGAAGQSSGTQLSWTIVSEIPASLDVEGLLDAASVGQLLVLKNLYSQFRANGLRVTVTLDLKQPNAADSTQNVIRDLQMSGVTISESNGLESATQPKTRLIAPDGSISKQWKGFVSPAEIGLSVRSVLGDPLYSQMESEIK